MNFFEHIEKYITGKEKHFGLTTICQLRDCPKETLDEKISLVISLMKIINGMKGRKSFKGSNEKKSLNDRKFYQLFADAQSFKNSQNIILNSYTKAVVMLCQDINLIIPAKPNYDYLIEALEKETGEYSDFIKLKLSETTKEQVEKRIADNDITGAYSVDFQIKGISIIDENDEEVIIKDAKDFSKIKNPELDYQIKKMFDENKGDKELRVIYNNIDILVGPARRPNKQLILKSLLFDQPYNKYNGLEKSYKIIEEYLEKNTEESKQNQED